jgi:hypothetical protein
LDKSFYGNRQTDTEANTIPYIITIVIIKEGRTKNEGRQERFDFEWNGGK